MTTWKLCNGCLQGRIWTPQLSITSKPESVFFHGSHFASGGEKPRIPKAATPEAFAEFMVGAPNYLLNLFAFFNNYESDAPGDCRETPAVWITLRSSGNVGRLDQLLSLDWLATCMSSFGKDPQSSVQEEYDSGAASHGLQLVNHESRSAQFPTGDYGFMLALRCSRSSGMSPGCSTSSALSLSNSHARPVWRLVRRWRAATGGQPPLIPNACTRCRWQQDFVIAPPGTCTHGA